MQKSSTNWKQVRTALGLTQKQVAAALGVSANYVWMIEKGTNQPSADLQQKFWALTDGQALSTTEESDRSTQSPVHSKSPGVVREESPPYGARTLIYQIPVEPWEAIALLTDAEWGNLMTRAVESKNAGAIGALTHEMKRRAKLPEKMPKPKEQP